MINSDSCTEVGSVEFEQYDELVGMTILSGMDKKPRRFGFTVMRNGSSQNLLSPDMSKVGFPVAPPGT